MVNGYDGDYELRAAVYKVYQLSPMVSASCVSAAFRVASHRGMSCIARRNGVRSVRHSEGCHTVSLLRCSVTYSVTVRCSVTYYSHLHTIVVWNCLMFKLH